MTFKSNESSYRGVVVVIDLSANFDLIYSTNPEEFLSVVLLWVGVI